MTVTLLQPTGEGDRTEWVYVTPLGTDHWDAMAAPDPPGIIFAGDPFDPDTHNVYGDTDLYTFDTSPITSPFPQITNVTFHATTNWEDDSPGVITLAVTLKQDGVETVGADASTALVVGAYELTWSYDFDPTQAGTVAWTLDRLASGQYGPTIHQAGSIGGQIAVTGFWIEVTTVEESLYLFASSDTDGYSSVYTRQADTTWVRLTDRNPGNLWFESESTDYASMLPNGYSVDGNLYSYVKHWFNIGSADYTMTRFNKTTRAIEGGIDFVPDVYSASAPFLAYWERDITDEGGTSVAWLPRFEQEIFRWDGASADYTSPEDHTWQWLANNLTDFTSFPKDVVVYGPALIKPCIVVRGGYLFRNASYYWLWTDAQLWTTANKNFYGPALLRWQDPNTPPDASSELGTGSFRGLFAPYLPSTSEGNGMSAVRTWSDAPLRWGAHFWLTTIIPSHFRREDSTLQAGTNPTFLYLLTAAGDVLPALDLPTSEQAHQVGGGVFYHKETDTVYAWAFSGATFPYPDRVHLFRLDSYDIGMGTFSWTALDTLDPPDAADFVGAIGDAGGIYWCSGFETDQEVYRFDVLAETWSTETIIGLTGDEQMTTLVKIASIVTTARRFFFGTIVG